MIAAIKRNIDCNNKNDKKDVLKSFLFFDVRLFRCLRPAVLQILRGSGTGWGCASLSGHEPLRGTDCLVVLQTPSHRGMSVLPHRVYFLKKYRVFMERISASEHVAELSQQTVSHVGIVGDEEE